MQKKTLLSLLTIFLTASTLQYSYAADTPIKACVNFKTGDARAVTSKTKCLKSEKFINLIFTAGSGITGPQGLSGKTILNGKVAPTDKVTGNDGDFYIDTVSSTMYGPRENGYWGTGVSLIGPRGGGGGGAQGPQGPQGVPGGFGDYAAFHDETTVTLVKDAETPVPLGITDFSKNISMANGSKIRFANSGKFNIAFSCQITKIDAGDDTVSIWLRKSSDGSTWSNLSWTNTDMIFSGTNARHVAAWNFFVDVTAGEYYQLMISSNGTTLKTQILSALPQSTPTRPAIPGTILTINQIG